MLFPRFPRLEALFGTRLDDIEASHIQRIVDSQIEVSFDLDFKAELYGKTDAQKRELATDVSALANASGGVLLIGINDTNGRASDSKPVALSESEELRMKQVVATSVFPFPEMLMRQFQADSDSTEGFFLLIVPGSQMAPYAVKVNEGFRYPIRDGRQTRYLAESEIAAAYRNRLTLSTQQVARLDQLDNEA